jgi:glycosyltransferase involved in cell wall biosynthesis
MAVLTAPSPGTRLQPYSPSRSVLVMTVVHNPYDSRIWFRQIDALLTSGWHVTYVAPFSGYDQKQPFRDARLPGSLTCIDIPRAEGRRRSRADRAARELLRAQARSHDLVLVHDPELVMAAVGLRLRNLVWDVHEDAAAALQIKEWMPKTLRPAVAALWRGAEHRAERSYELLLAEFAYQQRFRRHHPVIPNTVQVPINPGPPGCDRVVYLGTVTEARGCSLMIAVARALAALRDRRVRLEIIGDAPEQSSAEALRQAEREGILTWRGFLPSQTALARINGALAGLSLLDDLPNFRCSMPTKVIEYGACGIPVITTPLPLAEQLVRGSNSGLVVPWRDPKAVVRAVVALRDDPHLAALLGLNGHATALEQYDWRIWSRRFVYQMEIFAGRADRTHTTVSADAPVRSICRHDKTAGGASPVDDRAAAIKR